MSKSSQILSGLASLGKLAGSTIAKTIKKKIVKKNNAGSVSRKIDNVASKPRRVRRGNRSKLDPTLASSVPIMGQLANRSSVSVPVQYGVTTATRLRQQAIRIPYDTSQIVLQMSGSGQGVYFTNTPGSTTNANITLDLHPISNTLGAQSAMFGNAITNLAKAFVRWRLVSCKMVYTPAVGSSTAGNICVAYSNDPSQGGTVNWSNASSCSPNIKFAPWAVAEMDITPMLSKEWLYVYDGSNTTSAGQREAYAGTFLAYGFGLPGSTTLGSFQMTGEIEFFEVFDEADILLRSQRVPGSRWVAEASPDPSSSSSVSPLSTVSTSSRLPVVSEDCTYLLVRKNEP